MIDYSFKLLNAALHFDPTRAQIGFMMTNRGMPGASNVFYWFAKIEDAASCIRDELIGTLTTETLDELDIDYPKIHDQLINNMLEKSMVEDLCKIMSRDTQIEWIGTYKELISGNEKIPFELRKEFRWQRRPNRPNYDEITIEITKEKLKENKKIYDAYMQDTVSPPIKDDELSAFHIFLENLRGW